MVGDLVAHNLHDIVSVCDETDRDGGRQDSELPHRNRGILLRRLAIHPGVVNDCPGTDRVTNIVGAMRKRGSAGSENLHERVDVFDFVGILGSIGVDTLHASTLRRTVNTRLSSVDIVVQTIHETNDDHGGKTDEKGLDVLAFIDLTSTHGVVVQSTHSPTNWSTLLPELCMEPGLALGDKLLVSELLDFLASGSFLLVNGSNLISTALLQIIRVAERFGPHATRRKVVFLNNSVVGDDGLRSFRSSRAAPQKRTHESVVPSDVGIPFDDLGVDVRNEKDGCKQRDTRTSAHGDGGDIPRRFLVETKLRRPFVYNGKRANGASYQKEEWGSEDGPLDGVPAHVDNDFDEHEDGCTKTSGDGRGHTKT